MLSCRSGFMHLTDSLLCPWLLPWLLIDSWLLIVQFCEIQIRCYCSLWKKKKNLIQYKSYKNHNQKSFVCVRGRWRDFCLWSRIAWQLKWSVFCVVKQLEVLLILKNTQDRYPSSNCIPKFFFTHTSVLAVFIIRFAWPAVPPKKCWVCLNLFSFNWWRFATRWIIKLLFICSFCCIILIICLHFLIILFA